MAAPSRTLNAGYDACPEVYDKLRDCWLNRRRQQFIVNRLRGYRLPPGAAVLEIGSGTGWLLNGLGRLFPELSFVGLEPIGNYVEFAQRAAGANVRYVQGAAETFRPPDPATFQAVLSNDVLHHVDSTAAAISSLNRLCSRGTTWLSIEPNWKNPYTGLKQALTEGERNFRPGEFLALARREGWELQRSRHLFLIPPFVRSAPDFVKPIETALESIPFLAGGVCLELRRSAGGGDSRGSR